MPRRVHSSGSTKERSGAPWKESLQSPDHHEMPTDQSGVRKKSVFHRWTEASLLLDHTILSPTSLIQLRPSRCLISVAQSMVVRSLLGSAANKTKNSRLERSDEQDNHMTAYNNIDE